MKIPFISINSKNHNLWKNLNASFKRVFNSEVFLLGKELENFEKNFAKFIKTKYCLGVGSGTDALELVLRAINVNKDDAVITVSHTAVATISAIERAGATPVLIDINKNTYTMDLNLIEKKINIILNNNLIPKCIIPVHIYGQVAAIEKIKIICKKYNIFLLEDAAQAHGAMYRNKMVGNLGDAAAFSFYPTKNIGALGDAGAITTNNKKLYDRLLMLRQYGWKNRISYEPGIVSRMDEIQAAILNIKIKNFKINFALRQKIAKMYLTKIKNHLIQLPEISKDTLHAFHLFVVRVEKRNKFRKYLKEHGIETMIHYPVPVHLQKAYKHRLPLYFSYKSTENIMNNIVSIPIYPNLSPNKAQYIIKTINSFK